MGGWGEKEHKSNSDMGPLEMQDGITAVALIDIIVVSLMMYHGTEIVVRNPVSHHHVFTMLPFTKRWRGLLLEFTLLSSY